MYPSEMIEIMAASCNGKGLHWRDVVSATSRCMAAIADHWNYDDVPKPFDPVDGKLYGADSVVESEAYLYMQKFGSKIKGRVMFADQAGAELLRVQMHAMRKLKWLPTHKRGERRT